MSISRLTAIAALLSIQALQLSQAQSSLPPQVQADILKSKVVEAVRNDRPNEVLRLMDEYKALQGVSVPPVLRFNEAKAAEKASNFERTIASLEDFLKVATPSDPYYQEAIQWYGRLSSSAEYVRLQQQRKDDIAGANAKLKQETLAATLRAKTVDHSQLAGIEFAEGGGSVWISAIDPSKPLDDRWRVNDVWRSIEWPDCGQENCRNVAVPLTTRDQLRQAIRSARPPDTIFLVRVERNKRKYMVTFAEPSR